MFDLLLWTNRGEVFELTIYYQVQCVSPAKKFFGQLLYLFYRKDVTDKVVKLNIMDVDVLKQTHRVSFYTQFCHC